VDTSVLFRNDTRLGILVAADAGQVVPIWSVQIAAELTRTLLWVGRLDNGRRSISEEQYEDYRTKMYALVEEIDRVADVFRVAGATPRPEELAWAASADSDDLHVQLLAQLGRADYVASLNTRHFPNRRTTPSGVRGDLCGIVWLTPDQL
jgi:hypothetical protein